MWCYVVPMETRQTLNSPRPVTPHTSYHEVLSPYANHIGKGTSTYSSMKRRYDIKIHVSMLSFSTLMEQKKGTLIQNSKLWLFTSTTCFSLRVTSTVVYNGSTGNFQLGQTVRSLLSRTKGYNTCFKLPRKNIKS